MITDLQVARLVYWTRKHRALLARGLADGTGCTAEAARELGALDRLLDLVDPRAAPEPRGIRNRRGHVD